MRFNAGHPLLPSRVPGLVPHGTSVSDANAFPERNIMRQHILSILAAAIVAVAGSVVFTGACVPEPVPSFAAPGGPVAPESIAEALDVPCLTEDSDNCYWRADTRGNGLGRSFVTIEGHRFPLADVLAGE